MNGDVVREGHQTHTSVSPYSPCSLKELEARSSAASVTLYLLWLRKGVVVRKQFFMQATKDAWVDENRTEVI